jgi:small-conductance mechanosensitive channel
MNPNKDVELEEIKIKGNDPNTQNPQSIRVIDETNSYDSLNTSVMPNSSRKYEPTMTSVIGRKKKKQEGFDGDNSENDDSDDENDKKARLKRNMTQMLDYDQKKKEERYEKIGLGDSQEYDDFDWFADDYNNDRDKEDEKSDDEEKNENLKSKISKIPKAVRYWAWLILGDLIFSIPIILAICFSCIEDPSKKFEQWKTKDTTKCKGFFDIFDFPVFLWALWLIPTWSVYWLLMIFFHLVPGLFIHIVDFMFGYVPKKMINFADYIRFLQDYIVHALASFLSYIFLHIFFRIQDNDGNYVNKYIAFVDHLLLSIVAGCAIWAVEKIILQSFSISFHKSVYEDRIEEINRAITVLEYLNESRHRNVKLDAISLISTGNNEKKHFYKNFAKIAKNVVLKKTSKTKSVLLRTSWDAKNLARNLYYHLGGTDRAEDELTVENFKDFFITEQDAQDAFDLFDKDGNGDLSKAEVKSFVLDVYQEQKTLRKSMRDSNIALRKLDYLFKFVSVIIIVITILNVFDYDLKSVYVALSSIWVGTMFAISGTITSLVQSLIFLFITHPFDVGDRIEIDGQAYLVKDFGLTNVTMKKPNGEEIYAPTSELTSKFINNIRRSSPLIQVFNIAVNSKTTTAQQLQGLQERLQKFVEKESRNFQGRCVVSATDILDELRMNIAILVQHKHNGQDAIRVRQRNDLFVNEIKNSINILKLQLPNPSLLIINIANEDGEMVPYATENLNQQQISNE